MTVLPTFDHVRPGTLVEALNAIGDDSLPYAGGTELLVAMRLGLVRPRALVDLKGIEALTEIGENESYLFVGAGATHHDILEFLQGRQEYAAIRDMLSAVGNPRVRSVGTIGGNLCFAEPRSDVTTLFVAIDAMVEIVSHDLGARSLPLAQFIHGAYATDIHPGEIMTKVTIPRVPGSLVAYRKFQTGTRPTVGVAAVERSDRSGRVVIGAVCQAPSLWDVPTLHDIDPEAIADSIETISDISGSARHKRHLVAVLIRRAIAALGCRCE